MNRGELEEMLASRSAGGANAYAPAAYESPIEERLAWSIAKILPAGSALVAQVTLPTAIGAFRPDLLLYTPGKISALECDGKEFHKDELGDDARDAALLESGLIDQVIRFEGALLNLVPDDATYIVTLVHPEAFDARGTQIAANRASPQTKEIRRTSGTIYFHMRVSNTDVDEDDSRRPMEILTAVLIQKLQHSGGRPNMLMRMADIIRSGSVGSKTELVRAYRAEHYSD